MISKILLLIGFLVAVLAQGDGSQSETHVTEVFNVKTGTEKGGCDNYNVNKWYSVSIRLLEDISHALKEAQEAFEKGVTDSQIQKHLWTFFRIDATDASSKPFVDEMKENLTSVQGELKETADGPDKPWIFCDGKYAEQKKWSDKALEPETGVPNADGKTIKQVFPELFPFWIDDIKQYRYAEENDYCFKANRKNMAGTDDNFQPNTITFCPMNWKEVKYKTIDDIPAVTEEGISIKQFTVEGLTFFHEVFHYALESINTPDVAYNLNQITGGEPLEDGTFITPDQAIANPESWTMFALAWKLGLRNPKFTFESSVSKSL
ncbi:hypothetical protein FBEOM_13964 [Fusarium beomiforme]|uniref:Uncharacterized protein n=1 Tax=Fusarium beomiforme TaxID=44412 RepID=A0A9P5A4S1_9HYPO|nr:hypothetical protein FBEOM_13964 [Fusarium beomiforme]